jgi:Alpha/beta hydrolase of unknown function (DUF900)
MKTTRRGIPSIAIVVVVLFAVGLAIRAQTDNPLQPVALTNAPEGAAFFKMSDYIANGGSLGGPYPFMPDTNAPMYSLYGDTFLVDDAVITNDDELATIISLFAQPQDQFSRHLMGGGAMTLDDVDINPGDYTNSESGGGGSTNSYTPGVVTYPTNVLWIEVPTNSLATSNQFLVVLHNTIEDAPYDVLTSTNLALPLSQWTIEQSTLGVEGTNCSPVTLAMNGRSNLFVDARFGGSSDDSGLPDWWELEYFGTNGVDPFADDPSGDGWTYLDDFRKGFVPGTWHTPPPPQDFFARLDATGTNVVLTWRSGGGAVDHYEIDTGSDFSPTDIGEVDADTFTFTESTDFDFTDNPFGAQRLRVRAVFTHPDHADTQWIEGPRLGSLNRDIQIFRGPDAKYYLALQNPTENLSRIHLYWYGDDPAPIDIYVTNLVNGTIVLPPEAQGFLPEYAQLVDSNGEYSQNLRPKYYLSDQWSGGSATNFINAAVQMKENLIFLLRAATASHPFSYSSDLATFNAPEESYERGTNSSDYVYYGFQTYSPTVKFAFMDETRPVQENFLWRNFIFDIAEMNSGILASGANGDHAQDDASRYLTDDPAYIYNGSGSETPLPLAFTNASAPWLFFATPATNNPVALADLGLYLDGSGNLALAGGAFNVYGLPLNSAHFLSTSGYTTITRGGSGAPIGGSLFLEAAQPVLSTVDYYFVSQTPFFNYTYFYGYSGPAPAVPGSPTFSVTNVSPPMITGIGQPMTASGWEKMAITNGYSNKFAYLEQYFDSADVIDSNGVVTTNSAGLLSPYGDFFPTVAGPAALVTLPDIDTGERGTGVVNVVKLQLDVNHDGNMDLSFGGPDNTSPARPFTFWLNNDDDGVGIGNEIDFGTNSALADCFQGKIRSQRNLEDFARLQICGLPPLPPSQGYRVTLSMDSDGIDNTNGEEPVINIYPEFQPGGNGYLTDTNAAAFQLSQVAYQDIAVLDFNQTLGPIGQGAEYTLPLNADGISPFKYFLFEGVQPGKGRLVLTIWQNTNIVAQTGQWLDLHDIKDLYEQVAVGNVQRHWPEMVLNNPTSIFKVFSSLQQDTSQNKQLAVFVHGWRMPVSTWYEFSETMFKRLYWQGYQGGFASLFWPTRSTDTDGHILDFLTYNRSEHIAFKSGTGTAAYLNNIRTRFSDYQISVCSHSMGGIVMMEALKELAAANQQPINSYVMMQAAVPAQCYDAAITNYLDFVAMEQSIPTPNTYSNYAAGITNALQSNGKIVNFYNPLDFALGSWAINQSFSTSDTNEPGTIKPNWYLGYYTDGVTSILRTNGFNQSILNALIYDNFYDGPTRTITDPHELMPFVSRPRSLTVGAQDGMRGVVSAELNLETQFGFTDATYDHSAEFNRNIQDSVVKPFYPALIDNLFPAQ